MFSSSSVSVARGVNGVGGRWACYVRSLVSIKFLLDAPPPPRQETLALRPYGPTA